MNKLAKMKALWTEAVDAYYNRKRPIMTDAEFDALEDSITKLAPAWVSLNKTGVRVADKKTEVLLARPMPSLRKAYPEAIGKWCAKFVPKDRMPGYITMDKLDGSALQLRYVALRLKQVATRGDGLLGGDITFLAPHLNIPHIISGGSSELVLRCEAVIRRSVFDKKWAKHFDDPRSMVNGLLNRKTPHPALADIDIVVVGIYDLSIVTALQVAKANGFKTVPTSFVAEDEFAEHLAQRKAASLYDIDGLVVTTNEFRLNYASDDKPKDIIAFKVNAVADEVEATVKKIIWQVSGRGRIIPKICIEPTKIAGVMVQHATAHNAVWLMERGIGKGAVVKLVRSGGVIPKINSVVSKGSADYPTIPYRVIGVHYVALNPSKGTASGIDAKNIVKFMQTLGIKQLALKTATLLLPVFPTPLSYIEAWWCDGLAAKLASVIGAKTATNLVEEFDRVCAKPIPMRTLMVASQIFDVGIGERKLAMIEQSGISMNALLTGGYTRKKLIEVEGYSDITADLVITGLPEMAHFVARASKILHLDGALPARLPKVRGSLSGQCVSFTSYRDKAHEASVAAAGATVVPYGAKTSILLYKDGGKASAKVESAKDKGLRVCTFKELGL